MYFRLNPECHFIRGERCGAIFDLLDAKIYALDPQETSIVTSCEKNNPVLGREKILHDLKRLRLGNFYPKRIYVQKLRVGPGIKKSRYAVIHEPVELHRAFLEINNLCNRNCWFCGYYGIKRNLGCIGCNKWKDNSQPLNLERCREIVDELRDLDCRDLYITGGDLTLTWDKATDILDYARGKFKNIYMTLHQQSLSSDILNDLSGKVNTIIQTDNLNNMRFKGSATLLVMKPKDLKKILHIDGENMIESFTIENYSPLSNDLSTMSKRNISSFNIYKFLSNLEYHPCLGHTLSICYNGNVVPCPMMRDHNFGNISNTELSIIIKRGWDMIDKFWKLNLDEVEKCTGCEFRYVCRDCRALEKGLTGRLNGKMLCNYNPKEGKWS